MKVMASDADDPTYGSSARIVYSVPDGERFFTVDRQTGKHINESFLIESWQICMKTSSFA